MPLPHPQEGGELGFSRAGWGLSICILTSAVVHPGKRRGFPQNYSLSRVLPLDSVQAIFKMISPDDVKHLPDDENTPEKRAEKIWGFFGKKDDGELLLLPSL